MTIDECKLWYGDEGRRDRCDRWRARERRSLRRFLRTLFSLFSNQSARLLERKRFLRSTAKSREDRENYKDLVRAKLYKGWRRVSSRTNLDDLGDVFHKIHELACMVEGTSEKIRYVLYDMYKGYDHEETRFVASSFSRYGMKNENVKEKGKTHTHTQRATRSYRRFPLSLKKKLNTVLYICVSVRTFFAIIVEPRNHNEQFSLEKCSLVCTFRLFGYKIASRKKKN